MAGIWKDGRIDGNRGMVNWIISKSNRRLPVTFDDIHVLPVTFDDIHVSAWSIAYVFTNFVFMSCFIDCIYEFLWGQ